MFYLKELDIEKYGFLASPAKLRFNKDTNYLLGKNGTGKTTLLEIIGAFCSINFKRINSYGSDIQMSALFEDRDDEGLQMKVIYSESHSKIADPLLGVNFNKNSLPEEKSLLIYISNDSADIKININASDTFIQVGDSLEKVEYHNDWSLLLRAILTAKIAEKEQNEAREIFSDTYMFFFQYINLPRFAEGLEAENDFFNDKTSLYFTKENDEVKIFTIFSDNLINEEVITTKKNYPLFKKLFDDFENKREYNENIIFSKADIKSLEAICSFIDVDDIRLNYYIQDILLRENTLHFYLGSVKISVLLNNGSVIDYNQLSFGEKRLFHIIAYLAENYPAALLDEPVNGLHHKFIDHLISFSRQQDKQIFIANQNPILFDYIEIDSVEDFKTKFIYCNRVDDKMIWNNPSESDAEKFIEDYENQFLPVSMILRNRELW